MEFEYSILAKYLAGKTSAEELAVLLAWAKSSEKNGRIWQEVVELRMKDAFDRHNTEAAIERALQQVEARIDRKRVWMPFRRALRYAAMVAFIVGSALGYWMFRSASEDYLSIRVAEGESVKRILSLKVEYGLTNDPVDTPDVDALNARIGALTEQITEASS